MVEKGADTYQQVSFLTSDPGKLILLCYRHAILNLRTAKDEYQLNNYEAKAKHLQKALDCIGELNSALDFKRGGPIAKSLDALYNYMMRQLLAADIKRDFKAFEAVAAMLEELESAWEEITSSKNTTAPPAPRMISASGGSREWSV